MKSYPQLPIHNFKQFIVDLAKENNVVYKKTQIDALAQTFSALSDCEVALDLVETLIIALARANCIPKNYILILQSGYLHEKKFTIK